MLDVPGLPVYSALIPVQTYLNYACINFSRSSAV